LISKLKRRFDELLTPKITAPIINEYDNTEKTLELFFLVPAAYTGREIKLKVKFTGRPQPVSKAICESFNFIFGKTIVSKIDVIEPEFKFKNFRYIFIEFNQFNNFISLNKGIEYEIFAKVLFKEEKVKTLTTDFKDKVERVYNYAPDDDYDPGDYEPYYDVLKEGEGQIALNLTAISM